MDSSVFWETGAPVSTSQIAHFHTQQCATICYFTQQTTIQNNGVWFGMQPVSDLIAVVG